MKNFHKKESKYIHGLNQFILGFAHLSCQVCGDGSGVCTDINDNGQAKECPGETDVCIYSETSLWHLERSLGSLT